MPYVGWLVADPEIEVAGVSRAAMRRERIAAADELLNAVRGE